MSRSLLPAVAIAVLVVLSGCSGLIASNDDGPSYEAFPDASAIDQSVFEGHAALLANTSFTVDFNTTVWRQPPPSRTETFSGRFNGSQRVLVEPGASQYLYQPNVTILSRTCGFRAANLQSMYSKGKDVYALMRDDNGSTVQKGSICAVFNESSDEYLWQGWRETPMALPYSYISENVTYERRGIETFDGVEVMRYEATGADALSDSLREREPALSYKDVSMTLLVDTDGVIRYFRGEVDQVATSGDWWWNATLVHSVTNVGSTDVKKPDWASNVTAGS